MKTLLVLCRITIFASSGRHVHFDAENRLDTCRLRLFIKSQIAAHGAVVGHRHGLHTKLFDFTDEVIYLGQSIQHAVSGMVVQMDEVTRGKLVLACFLTANADRRYISPIILLFRLYFPLTHR